MCFVWETSWQRGTFTTKKNRMIIPLFPIISDRSGVYQVGAWTLSDDSEGNSFAETTSMSPSGALLSVEFRKSVQKRFQTILEVRSRVKYCLQDELFTSSPRKSSIATNSRANLTLLWSRISGRNRSTSRWFWSFAHERNFVLQGQLLGRICKLIA